MVNYGISFSQRKTKLFLGNLDAAKNLCKSFDGIFAQVPNMVEFDVLVKFLLNVREILEKIPF